MPKIPTIIVKLKKFKNKTVIINESDYDVDLHSKVVSKVTEPVAKKTTKIIDKAVKKGKEDADSISD